MVCNSIDAEMISKMFLAGAKNLESKKDWINELNVFPVPDGDTGTNMTLTILAAAREVAALEKPDMASLSKAIASGSLRGARGNSGVILSQLFRGFTKGIQEYDKVTVPVMADAFSKAVETAYKAVMKPKEGTILTVARAGAEKAAELFEDGEEDLNVFFREVIAHAQRMLDQTPDMLPVLKQAGVVDSGGQGLLEVMRGAYDAFLGKETDFSLERGAEISAVKEAGLPAGEETEIHFGYCTEFIIMLQKELTQAQETELKSYLESIGDSIVVVADEEVVKVHVHTNDPGLAIQRALRYGALSNMKIDNMRLEHQEKLIRMSDRQVLEKQEEAAKKDTAFIAVSAGEGLDVIFRDLGVDYLIQGGQTMNPSTEDMLRAIEKVNADTVFILPNNKNIILAANQAQSLTEDKRVIVIPTKTVPQGITAVINYVPELSPEDNEAAMLEEIGRVKTGQVTYAVRDTAIDGKVIKQGDYMGIGDQGIVSVGTDLEKTTLAMLDELVDGETELISIYYGNEISEEEAEKLQQEVGDRYINCDIELQFGGQPVYYYVVSAE